MSPGQTVRMGRRMVAHHLPFLLLSAVFYAALYFTRPYADRISRASFATAYPALLFLTASLLLGPWSVLHSAIGQCVHLRGRPWLYYIYDPKQHHGFALRRDVFGFSNDTGLLAALVVIALLATSNDYFLCRLGGPGWKRLQRWNYAAFALTAAHALGYQVSQKGNVGFHVTLYVCIGVTVVLQGAGFVRRRNRARG